MQRHAVLLLCALVGFANALNIDAKDFSRNTVNINGKDYFVGKEITLAWFDAVETCNALGMSLASLETAEETTDVVDYLTGDAALSSVDFWLSGHRVQGGWIWSGSGQIMNAVSWAAGQPDEQGANVCVSIVGSAGLYDNLCTLQKNFICEP